MFIVLPLSVACRTVSESPSAYRLTRSQESALRTVLSQHSTWRLALGRDNSDSAGMEDRRRTDPGFEPYFTSRTARGTEGDFAVVARTPGGWAVLYFRASESGAYGAEIAMEADWLGEAFIALSGDTLRVAPFRSDEIFTFTWDSLSQKLRLEPPRTDSLPQ